MKKTEIIRNLATATVPISLVLFGIGWLVFKSMLAALVLPVILFIASLYSSIGKYLDDIKRTSSGVTKRKFSATAAFELMAPDDSVGPSLCMDIGDGSYLLINGQWIYDDEIYGEDARKYFDQESDIFNGYQSPYSFPATEFELWLSNLDGKPMKLVVSGDYLTPRPVSSPTPEKYWRCSHAIIDKDEVDVRR